MMPVKRACRDHTLSLQIPDLKPRRSRPTAPGHLAMVRRQQLYVGDEDLKMRYAVHVWSDGLLRSVRSPG